ncbi:MAG: hypothetical protein ACLPPF_06720 [Rhodomicrobium sp.]
MSARTVFLARLFGLYCLVMGAAMLLQRDAFPAMVSAITANAPLVLTMAVFTLFGGLAMVLLHNIWSGGALPIIITLLGWLTLIKSVMLLFLPPARLSALYAAVSANAYLISGVLTLLLGVYLTAAGFRTKLKLSAAGSSPKRA